MSYRSITGADRRLTTLTRYVVAAGLVTVAVLGPGLATLPLDDPAVWVTAIATVPFLTLITPRFDRYWTNLAGCLYAVTWATVLVSVTGGWQSHFTFLYVVIVVLQGAFFSAMAMAAHVLVVRLRTSEASFRLLAENATDVVYRFQLGEDPGFQYVSPAIRDITGYSPATAARLREADEVKNAFLQAVSHDLRTPVTSLLGYATTLRDRLDILPEDHVRMMADRMVVNADKLRRMLTDLLDVDRLTTGVVQAERTPVDVTALVHRVLAELEPGDRPVNLDLEPVIVDADAPQIERVLENLILNAAKHTPIGTPIWVSVALDDGEVELTVEDAGPGVPESLRTAVFEVFNRGTEGAGLDPASSGVGLALVTRQVDLHQGRVGQPDVEAGTVQPRGTASRSPNAPFRCRFGGSVTPPWHHGPRRTTPMLFDTHVVHTLVGTRRGGPMTTRLLETPDERTRTWQAAADWIADVLDREGLTRARAVLGLREPCRLDLLVDGTSVASVPVDGDLGQACGVSVATAMLERQSRGDCERWELRLTVHDRELGADLLIREWRY